MGSLILHQLLSEYLCLQVEGCQFSDSTCNFRINTLCFPKRAGTHSCPFGFSMMKPCSLNLHSAGTTSPDSEMMRNPQRLLRSSRSVDTMKIVIYIFFLIVCIFLILVIFRITRTAFRTIFKSLKSLYIDLDIEKKVNTFKDWLNQNSDG